MPHLRIVSDALWYRANQKIDNRQLRTDIPTGPDHPLFGIPRDSRSPLSKIFICDCCGNKMHQTGRNEGGFKCSACDKTGVCWNRATALRANVLRNLSGAISGKLLSMTGVVEAMVQYVKTLNADQSGREARIVQLRSELRALTVQRDNLYLVAQCGQETPDTVPK